MHSCNREMERAAIDAVESVIDRLEPRAGAAVETVLERAASFDVVAGAVLGDEKIRAGRRRGDIWFDTLLSNHRADMSHAGRAPRMRT